MPGEKVRWSGREELMIVNCRLSIGALQSDLILVLPSLGGINVPIKVFPSVKSTIDNRQSKITYVRTSRRIRPYNI